MHRRTPPAPRSCDGAPWAEREEHICRRRGCTRCGLGRTSPRATPLPEGFEPDRLSDADCPRAPSRSARTVADDTEACR